MKRLWCSIATSLATALTAFVVEAESPEAPASSTMGQMVDTDMPATYRLPPVQVPAEVAAVPSPTFSGPLAPSVYWPIPVTVDPQDMPAVTPAGSSPDTGPGDAGENIESSPIRVAVVEPQAAGAKPQAAEAKPQAALATIAPEPTETRSAAARETDVTSQLLPAVQRGFALAQRGALYAARTEFVQVLRRVAQARDAAADTSEHSRALAAGLRALNEAEDFVPDGVQLEAELDVRTTASSHRTNVLPEVPAEVSPSEAAALYHEFARKQLTTAVDGEQAGSMALHGLGTIYARLASRKDDDVQLTRSAMTMYSAALDACPNNHLAANELGVLVCRSGRAEEAAALFMQTIDFAPSAVAYHNLAIAQQRGGRMVEAAANELESQRLAAQERARGDVSRRAGVQWVTPEEMARASQPIHRTATPVMPPAPESPVPAPPKSTWQRVVDATKSLPLPGRRANENLGPMPAERLARPIATGTGNQRQWR